MKILFFGITGALGTAFEIVSPGLGVELIGLSHETIDITDKKDVERLIENVEVDVVVNGVAIVGINPCEEEPELAFKTHCSAVLNMARCCARRDLIFVQPSSHAVFDGTARQPYQENATPNPLNVYGISKMAGDHIALNLCPRGYVPRYPTMFGPRRNNSPGFVEKMADRMANGDPIQVADDKIDSPTYTLDAATATINLIKNQNPYGVYHIANDGEVSYFELIEQLAQLSGQEADIRRAKDADFPSPAAKPLYTALASSKLPKLRDWRAALADYVEADI